MANTNNIDSLNVALPPYDYVKEFFDTSTDNKLKPNWCVNLFQIPFTNTMGRLVIDNRKQTIKFLVDDCKIYNENCLRDANFNKKDYEKLCTVIKRTYKAILLGLLNYTTDNDEWDNNTYKIVLV